MALVSEEKNLQKDCGVEAHDERASRHLRGSPLFVHPMIAQSNFQFDIEESQQSNNLKPRSSAVELSAQGPDIRVDSDAAQDHNPREGSSAFVLDSFYG